MIVTKEKMKEAASARGGYTSQQIRIAKEYLGSDKGFMKKLMGLSVDSVFWNKFVAAGSKCDKHKDRILNKIPTKTDWAWNPSDRDIPGIKRSGKGKKNAGRRKKKRNKVSGYDNHCFYNSREWLELRVRVLERYDCKCMMCGRSPRNDDIVIHVDHIKPRSKYPHLSLCFDNLQLLCRDCNLGKGNKYETDYRPYTKDIDEILDDILLRESPL